MKPFLPFVAALLGLAFGYLGRDYRAVPASPPTSWAPLPAPGAAPSKSSGRVGEALRTLHRRPSLQQLAALGDMLADFTPAQIRDFIEGQERDQQTARDYRTANLFQWWLAKDPESAAAWLRPRLVALAKAGKTGFGMSDPSNSGMLREWTKQFPDDALALAREYPRSMLAESVLFELEGPARNHPTAEVWATLRDFPESTERVRPVSNFLASWATLDAGAAFAAAQSLPPGPTHNAALEAVLPSLAKKDPALAFAQYNQAGLSNPELVTKMIAQAADRDPTDMATWLETLSSTQFANAAPSLVEKWAADDPAAAFAWAAEHQVPLWTEGDVVETSRNEGFSRTMSSSSYPGVSAFGAAMANQPEATLAWLHSLPAGPERDQMTMNLLSSAKPDQAIAMLAEVRPEDQSTAAADIAMHLTSDPKRVVDWADSLPEGPIRSRVWHTFGLFSAQVPLPAPGPDRDALLSGRALGNQSSLNVIMDIGNRELQHQTFDQVMESRTATTSPPEFFQAAQDWMESANLPEEWKSKWRKK